MTTIQLENVHVTLDSKEVLHGIDFKVEKGQFLGLIGPNGSGKTTLVKAIANLLPIQKGEITIQQKDHLAYNQKEFAKQIGYVPQETVVGFDFIAREIVAMGRHVHGSFFKRETREDRQTVETAMKETKTIHLAEQSVLSLSGGQKQLIMIAKALAQDTPIILLDEPISALDIYYQVHILSLLKRLCAEGRTIIIVLHDLNLAARFCDELLLLNDGKVQKHGRPEEVLDQSLLKKIYHIQAKVRKDELTNSMTVTPFL